MKKRVLCLLAVLLLLALPLGRADFGDFSGGSDYGGSSDWGSYNSSDYDDYDSGFNYIGHYGRGLSLSQEMIVIVIVVAVLLIANALRKKTGALPAGAKTVDVSTLEPVSALADFSESEFTGKLSNMYVRLQEAWAEGNLKPVEPLLTAPYYAQMTAQLKRDFTDKGIASHIEHLSVLDVNLLGCRPGKDGEPDRLFAEINARFVNYLTDADGELIRGSRKNEIYMQYEWTLERSAVIGAERTVNCPNCGAPVDANRFARCPYCDSVIEKSGYDWVLAQIKGISRRTVRH